MDLLYLMCWVEPFLVLPAEVPVHLHHLEQLRLYPGTAKFLSEQCNQIGQFIGLWATFQSLWKQ